MKELLLNKAFLGLTVALTLLLSGCMLQEAEQTLDTAYDGNSYTPGEPAQGCHVDNYASPEEFITNKIDILIVPDTSGSIVKERDDIAKGFDNFINILPEQVDYRIGVMLAHGPQSPFTG